MAFLRAYSMRSSGVLPGRGAQRGDPFLGALAGIAAPFAKKLAGKALSKLTGGRLIGKGGGGALAKKIAGGAAAFGGAVGTGVVVSKVAGRLTMAPGMRRRYRRMNAGNAKALRRAFRRVEAFGKLAQKAGYVRRKGRTQVCPTPSKRKIC